jgi:hypothetical protein
LLRARAIVRGESFWVWVINEVPQGHLCTWTITDPPKRSGPVNSRFELPLTETGGRKPKSVKRPNLIDPIS